MSRYGSGWERFMRKSIGKVIFWCLLGVLTVVCSVKSTPERSAGEKIGPAIEARSGRLVVRPEPATLMVLTGSGLMAVSVRVMRRCRSSLR